MQLVFAIVVPFGHIYDSNFHMMFGNLAYAIGKSPEALARNGERSRIIFCLGKEEESSSRKNHNLMRVINRCGKLVDKLSR
jgi:hypothetical protein